MISKTSLYNKPLFFKNIRRLKWVFIANLLLLVVIYPLIMFLLNMKTDAEFVAQTQRMLTFNDFIPGTICVIVFPVLYGILSFKYLQSSGETVRIHSMPITRKTLFLTHSLSGLLVLSIPYLVSGLLLFLLVSVVPIGALTFSSIIQWVGISLFFSYIFYAGTVFSGMIIGNSILQGFFVYILLLLPSGLIILISSNLASILRGYFPRGIFNIDYVSPLSGFLRISGFRGRPPFIPAPFFMPDWSWYLSTAFFFVFMIGAYRLYKHRNLEHTGQTVQIPSLKPILEYLGVFCSTLLLGYVFIGINDSLISILIGYLLGGILGYVLIEMALQKTIQCHLSFKKISVMLGIFFIGIAVIRLDFTHFSSKTMPLENIQEVCFTGDGYSNSPDSASSGYTSLETITAIQNLYLKTIQISSDLSGLLNESQHYEVFSFAFTDKQGHSFIRSFPVPKSMLLSELKQVYQTKAYICSQNPELTIDSRDVESVRLESMLGTVVISDPKVIQNLIDTAQKELYEHEEKSLPNSYSSFLQLYATMPNTAPSYPYKKYPEQPKGERVDITFNILNSCDETFQLLSSSPELSQLLIKPESILKILIKPLSSSESKEPNVLYTTYSIEKTDPTIIVIDDPAKIKQLFEMPLANNANSFDDYLANYIFKSNQSGARIGFLLSDDLPPNLLKK